MLGYNVLNIYLLLVYRSVARKCEQDGQHVCRFVFIPLIFKEIILISIAISKNEEIVCDQLRTAWAEPLSPSWTLCSIIARIGAIPVPGPTKTQGTSELGVRIPPLTSRTGISITIVNVTDRVVYPRASQQAILYTHHIEVASDLSCTSQSPHTSGSHSDASTSANPKYFHYL